MTEKILITGSVSFIGIILILRFSLVGIAIVAITVIFSSFLFSFFYCEIALKKLKRWEKKHELVNKRKTKKQ